MRVVVIPSSPDLLIIALQSCRELFPELLMVIDTRLMQIEMDLSGTEFEHDGSWEVDHGTHILRVN